ncbi:MAG: formylglycine-generating enzyme family protein [Planctomycetes bacterium]|nr:formylglycine-generating enzyme family protein [Planctomycetota bacterium]
MHVYDAIFILQRLFEGGEPFACADAADADDNGKIDITDAIYILNFAFVTKAARPRRLPPAPYPSCGEDPTLDDPGDLGCERYGGCAPLPEFVNSIKMPFVWIEPGDFSMGSPESERGRDIFSLGMTRVPDEDLHLVHITCGFYMSATEVTQEEFRAVMGYNPSEPTARPGLAVNRVSWREAVAFCAKLTAREELTEPGRVYRLPTEAEWEYACRAGTTTRYSFGDALDCDDIDGLCEIFDENMWYNGNVAGVWPPAVGTKPPNPWGLHDMHGGLAEWCQDWYGPYPKGEVTDPSGPKHGTEKVIRGNAIVLPVWGRSAARPRSLPEIGTGGFNFGFRVVFGGCPAPPLTRP